MYEFFRKALKTHTFSASMYEFFQKALKNAYFFFSDV